MRAVEDRVVGDQEEQVPGLSSGAEQAAEERAGREVERAPGLLGGEGQRRRPAPFRRQRRQVHHR